MPFSYIKIQFNINAFEKMYDLIIRLFNVIVYYMNELALFHLTIYYSTSFHEAGRGNLGTGSYTI